ncbi:MAG: cytosine permease [Victivallales bacterium]|nr:cytosine permease [Victivallales bacterium]
MSKQLLKNSGDFEQGAVPQTSRRGFWSMLVVMLGFTFFSASMWAGGTLGTGMTFTGLLWAILAGNLLLGAYTGTLAFMAAKTGNSVHILSRYAFGVRGSYLPSALLAFTQIGWFGVGIAMFALPLQEWLVGYGKIQPDNEGALWAIVIVTGLLMTSTAYFGIRSLTILSFIAVPAIIILGCWSSGLVLFGKNGIGLSGLLAAQPSPEAVIGATAAIAISIGSFISGGTCTPDFVRFSKGPKIAVWTTIIAFFLGNSLMFLFGAIGTMGCGMNDISKVLAAQKLLVFAILALGLNIWTTNDNAIYTSGLGLSNITGIPKRFTVLFNGLLGTVLAIWLNNHFVAYLNFLNVLIPPVGAILITDFFVRHAGKYPETKDAKFMDVNWTAVVAWAIGCGVAFVDVGIKALNGMAAAAAVYIFLSIAVQYFKDHPADAAEK